MKNPFDVKKIREDFPILKRKINGKPLVYFDNAATSQKPKVVIDAIKTYYETYNANIHRGIHKLSEEASLKYEEAHDKTASFVKAKGREEIVFTRNTTESLNLLAYTLSKQLTSDDEIVITQMEHHSNFVPWQYVAKQTGAKLKFIEIDENGELKLDNISDVITNKTKIVSVTHVSNALGTINDVAKIGKIAKENGAYFIVDGAQSAPHMPIDVKKIGCDFFAFSGHKMLAPTGIGVLYGKKEIFEEMDPFLYGGGMIREVSVKETTWDDLPWKFEAGTPNIADGIGLAAAIDYLNKIGMENIQEYEHQLIKYAIKKTENIDGFHLYGPKENRSGILSFNLYSGKTLIHPHDLSTIVDNQGIAIRGGHHCNMPLMELLGINGTSRASFYIYNTKEEIDFFVKVLEEAKNLFR